MTGYDRIALPDAHFLSSAINPLLVVIWLGAVSWDWRRRGVFPGSYALASVVAVAGTYLIVHGFRWLHLWPGHPEFPSGHETFGASIGTSLVLWDVKWLIVVPLLVGILGVALVRAHYHDWLDIEGALVVSPVLTWLCHLLIGKRRRKAEARASAG